MKIQSAGVEIYIEGEYDSDLSTSRPPLIFLHGFTLSSMEWLPLFGVYENDYQPIAVDIIGHGRSSTPEEAYYYSFEFFSTVLSDILSELEIDAAHWIGYSFGSRILLYYAVNYPERILSLILEGTSPGIRDESERTQRRLQDENLARYIQVNPLEKFVERWIQHPLFANQKNFPLRQQQRAKEIRLNNSPTGLANSLRQMGRGNMPPLWDQLSTIASPVLLLAGEKDPKHVKILEEAEQSIPDCESVIIPGAGHNIHFERPEKFADITLEFLNRQQ